MPMRLIILSVLVSVGQIALAACQTPQTNVVTICAMNDVSPERVDRMVERISNLEARETATSATRAHRIAAVEAACDQNRSRIEKLNDRNDGELIERAGKFYAERYGELKDANDRFSEYANKWMTIMGWIVGSVSVIVALASLIIGCAVPAYEFRKRNKQVDVIAERMAAMEKAGVEERKFHRRGMRDQARWMLSIFVQTIDVSPRKNSVDRQRLMHMLSCFLLQFYQLIDGCVRAEDAAGLKEEVSHFAGFINRWLSKDDPNAYNAFESAMLGVKKQINPDRAKYESLLEVESKEFVLLETLFKKMGVWA